jgi:hypothetical protein
MAEDIFSDYERFSEYFSYEPETGLIRWTKRSGKRGRVGQIAGNLDPKGYWRISFLGGTFQAHRIAFLLQQRTWPAGEVDHINGNRSDNRWCNLRQASRSLNGQNIRRPMSTNTSGFLGVSFHKGNGRWVAAIKVARKTLFLGQFGTPEEAHACYLAAKRRLHEGCTI